MELKDYEPLITAFLKQISDDLYTYYITRKRIKYLTTMPRWFTELLDDCDNRVMVVAAGVLFGVETRKVLELILMQVRARVSEERKAA